MKTLIKKEIRLLLPAWVVAMLLAIVPAWIGGAALNLDYQIHQVHSEFRLEEFVPVLFALGILLLGISTFGQEFNQNTFQVLLSQPMERARVWRTKITVLAVAFLSIWLVAIVSLWSQFYLYDNLHVATYLKGHIHLAYDSGAVGYAVIFLTVAALAVSSGGLWTTLLLRQTAGAFWFTLIIPLAIMIAIEIVVSFFPVSDQVADTVTMAALFVYGIAGFFYARRLFFNVQDLGGAGQDIALSWFKEKSGSVAASDSQPRHWIFASLRKEFQLHQLNVFIAIGVLALHLMTMLIRKIHPNFVNPNTRYIVESVWVLWLLMPLLIGGAAVAEERKLGVIESQLCLPVSRRAQFLIKFFVALALSLFFGAVIPSVIEHSLTFGETDWINFWIFYAAAGLFFVSFYASTLTRSTLLALGVAIGIPAVLGPVMGLAFHWLFYGLWATYPLYVVQGIVVCLIYFGVPVLVAVVAWLMFRNFKWLYENRKLWRLNTAVILVSFVFIYILCNAIFFRAWEWFAPLESSRGPARLSASTPVKLSGNWWTLTAARPDGSLWSEDVDNWPITSGKISSLEWEVLHPDLHSARLIGGSNWLDTADTYLMTVGVQSDGSLWAIPHLPNGDRRMQRIGDGTDWSQVANSANSFLLLKKDGSVWLWPGTNNLDSVNTIAGRVRKALAAQPERLDNGTNWTGFFPIGPNWTFVKKNDGTLWNRLPGREGTNNPPHLVQNTNFSDQWISYGDNYWSSAGVDTNNELWFFFHPKSNEIWSDGPAVYSTAIKLDSNPVWKAVAFSSRDSLILLKTDGTLWEWKFAMAQDRNWQGEYEPPPFRPFQLGRNSDWVALARDFADVALASDGSLWSWGQMSDRIWLAPSRRPTYMGNIFHGDTAGR
jgi:ABC-type transport system involved in multi-copper enzyme maturation permease subunit